MSYFDFEGEVDGWSTVDAQKENEKGDVIKKLPNNIAKRISTDYALMGEHSLKVESRANDSGKFKHFLYFNPDEAFKAHGAVMYVYIPKPPDNVDIRYLQICSTVKDWACNEGTKPEPNTWTPLILDLSQKEKDIGPLYKNSLDELAIQWVFTTDGDATFDLYFDSGELLQEGK